MHVKTVLLILSALSAVVPQIGCTSTPVADSRSRSSNETSPAAAVRVSDVGSKAAETAIAVDSGGNIYVAYVEHAEDKSADLFVHKYDASLKSISPAVQINPVKGAVKAWYGDPPTIAVAPDKTIYVGWTMRNGGGIDYVVSGSRDGGQTFGEPTKINDDAAPASHGMHSIAVDAGGTIYAAWLDERNVHKVAEHGSMNRPAADGFQIVKIDHKGNESQQAPEPNSEVFFAVSADGGKTFSKNQRIASEVCPCCKTAVIANEGRVYVSWRQVLDGDHRHIAVASSTDGGRTFPPRTIVSDDNWQLSACPVSGAAMYARPGGELNVAWYTAGDAGQAGYYIAKTVDGGGTFGSRLFVGEGASGTPAIIPTNADPVLVMPGQDEQVTIARISDQGGSYDMQRGVLRGANPAAVFANGSIYITFVKKENNSGTVWLAKR